MIKNRINNRYEIIKQIGVQGSVYYFLAYDSLKSINVIVTIVIYKNMKNVHKVNNIKTYYECLVLWSKKNNINISEIRDFGEVVEKKQELLEQLQVDYKILNETYCFYFSNTQETDWIFLKDIKEKPKTLLEYIFPIASSLSLLHNKGLIFYNLSPLNILCNTKTKAIKFLPPVIPLCHFCFLLSEYKAPELPYLHDTRVDIYSLGVTFYEIITQELPEDDIQENLERFLPKKYSSLILKCLAVDPSHRFSDLAELAYSFGEILENPEEIPGRKYILKKWISTEVVKKLKAFIESIADNSQKKSSFFMRVEQVGKTSLLRQACEFCEQKHIRNIVIKCNEASVSSLFYNLSKLNKGIIQEREYRDIALKDYFSIEEIYHKTKARIQSSFLEVQDPIVIFIDDLHLAGNEVLDIIENFMNSFELQSKKIFLVGCSTCDQENTFDLFLEKQSQNQGNFEIYDLGSYDSEDVATFIANAFGIEKAPEKFASFLSVETDNNIGYVREILNILMKKDILHRDDMDWCIEANSIEEIALPETFSDSLNIHKSLFGEKTANIIKVLQLLVAPIHFETLAKIIQPNEESIEKLWKLSYDNIVFIDTDFSISLSGNKTYEFDSYGDIPERLFLLLKSKKLTLYEKFLFLEASFTLGNSKYIMDYISEIFDYLVALGFEEYLEKYLEKCLGRINSKHLERLQNVAELSLFLKRYTICSRFYKKMVTDYITPISFVGLARLELITDEISKAVQTLKHLKSLITQKNSLEYAWYYALRAKIKLLSGDMDDYKQSIERALKTIEKLIAEGKDVKPSFHLYYVIITEDIPEFGSFALEKFTFANRLAQSLAYSEVQMKLFYHIAYTNTITSQYEDALENFQKSLELSRNLLYPVSEAKALLGLVQVYIEMNDLEKAENFLEQSQEISKRFSLKSLLGEAYFLYGLLEMQRDDFEKASHFYREGISLLRKYSEKKQLCIALVYYCELLIEDKSAEVEKYYKEARKIAKQLKLPRLLIHTTLLKVRIHYSLDNVTPELVSELKKTLVYGEEYQYDEYLCKIYYYLGVLTRYEGDIEKTLEYFHLAQKILEKISKHFSAKVKKLYMRSPFVKRLSSMLTSLTSELPLDMTSSSDIQVGESDIRNFIDMDVVNTYKSEVFSQNIHSYSEENIALRRLLEINKTLNREHDIQKLLDLIMDTAIEITKAERGFLIFTNTKKEKAFEVARNFEKEDIIHPEFEISNSITEKVIRTGLPILSTDAIEDSRFDGFLSVSELKLHSVLAVPLRVKEKILGALYIDNRFEKAVFSEKERDILEAFSDQAAIALQNTRLIQENIQKQEELEKNKKRIEKLNKELEAANAKLAKKIEKKERELKDVKDILVRNQSKYKYHNIIGQSKAMQDVFHILDRVSNKNIPVFIYGESGTGKELFARAIHFNGARKEKEFLSENCAAISETLLSSELFGHAKGAFTGAYTDKKGLFELADGGTLFLDEVGDMSPSMQANLLRVLENNVIRRVGGKEEIPVDVRIISASNKDLSELVAQKVFREDLFFRLKVVQINLPPLRSRKEDLPLLVNHFLREYANETGAPLRSVNKKSISYLMNHSWPGNVRELKNCLYNALSLNDEMELLPSHFLDINEDEGGTENNFFEKEMSIDEYARLFVLNNQGKYNDSQLSKILGFSRKTLWEKRKKWELFKN